MKLQASITVEIEAADFVDAANHQRRIEGLMADMRAAYPGAKLTFRERRAPRRGSPVSSLRASAATPQPTGRLSNYVD